MTLRRWHALGLAAALPLLGGSICGEVFADFAQRELILDPVEEIAFEVDAGGVEVYAFDRNGTNLFYALVGSLNDIGTVDWAVDGDALEVVSLCDSTDHCDVSWYAEIPFGVAVDVQAHDGDVKITGVDAPITADVQSGGFEGAHLRTPVVDVAAQSGDVKIEMYVPPTDLRVAVGEGNVELVLPPGSYRCELATSDGDVDTTGVACDPMATAVVTVDVDVGDITLLPGELP